MAVTSDDCKKLIAATYPETGVADWKRVRKYKDAEGLTIRDFSNAKANMRISLSRM